MNFNPETLLKKMQKMHDEQMELVKKNSENKAKAESAAAAEKLEDELITTLKTYKNAESSIISAEQNYVENALPNGSNTYTQLLKTRYQNVADKIKNNANKKHTIYINDIKSLISDYEIATIYNSRIDYLFNKYKQDNKKLKSKISEEKGIVETNDRKTWYELNQQETIDLFKPYLIGLYLCILVVYIVFGGYFEREEYKKWQIWLVIALYILFPFILFSIVVKCFQAYENIVYYLNNKAPKDVYVNLAQQ